MTRKPFRVHPEWVQYAHGPAAEDGQPLAVELCGLPEVNGAVYVPSDRADLVRELVSVAELYLYDSSLQDDARLWMRAYPRRMTQRATECLARWRAVA